MESNKIDLYKAVSSDFIANIGSTTMRGDYLSSYGYGQSQASCKTGLKDQIKMLRRILLEISNELK